MNNAQIPTCVPTAKELITITAPPKNTTTDVETNADITDNRNTTIPLSNKSEYPYILLIDENII